MTLGTIKLEVGGAMGPYEPLVTVSPLWGAMGPGNPTVLRRTYGPAESKNSSGNNCNTRNTITTTMRQQWRADSYGPREPHLSPLYYRFLPIFTDFYRLFT